MPISFLTVAFGNVLAPDLHFELKLYEALPSPIIHKCSEAELELTGLLAAGGFEFGGVRFFVRCRDRYLAARHSWEFDIAVSKMAHNQGRAWCR